jgi:Plasmid pRiA4b ORF-3-like protein
MAKKKASGGETKSDFLRKVLSKNIDLDYRQVNRLWAKKGYAGDSTTTRLNQVLPRSGERFEYMYDFGDSWRHEVHYEGVKPAEQGRQYPRCLEGKRACPPEDVGGTWAYLDFLEAIANPKNPEHDELLEWVGGKFDPEAFSPAVATRNMTRVVVT